MKAEPAGKKSDRLQLIFKIAVTLVIFLYLYISVNAADIYSTFLSADPALLFLGFILVIPNIGFQFYKWKILCNEMLGIYDNKKIMMSLFFGFSGGIATPFRLGEYVGRAMALDEKEFIDVSAATLIDKLFVLLGVAIAGVFSFIYFLQQYTGLSVPAAYILYTASAIILVFLFPVLKRIEKNQALREKLCSVRYAGSFIKSLFSFRKLGKRTVIKIIIVTIVLCGVYISQFAIFAMAYSGKNSFGVYFWAGLLVMFTKTFIPPVTFGELGIREGASVYYFSRLNESTAAALNTSLSLFAVNILLTSLIGLVMVLVRRRKKN